MSPQRSWTAGVVREVLPNGLTLLAQREPSAPAVAVVTHVNAGFFDEPDRWSGISHVLEHMFFKGTPTGGVGEIARATKAAGGYLNAGTSYDYTSYFAVLPARGLAAAIEIQADALRHAQLDGEELAREIVVIIEEARRKQDTPASVAQESLHALLYDRHRIRRWRIGTEDVLRSLSRDDLVTYYGTRYVPSRTNPRGGRVLVAHLHDLYEFYGEHNGVRVARKHISWYTKGLAGSAAFRHAMNQLQTCAEQLAAVNTFFAELSGQGERLTYVEEELAA